MALYIDNEQVKQLVTVEDALDAVEAAFRHWGEGKAVNEPRRRLVTRQGGFQVMPALDTVTGVGGHKTYGGPGGNLCTLFDLNTGAVLALMEAGRLGQLRTGAASGVATKYMARSDATTLGVIGTGYQARTQVEAICAVRPIKRVRVYSRVPEHREQFAQQVQEALGIEVAPSASAEEAVSNADIVCTVTNSRTPVLQGTWLRDGVHINAVGSNSLLRQEIDDNCVSRSSVIAVDDVAQVDLEGGDLISALARGLITRTQLIDLAHIVMGRMAGRTHDAQITLFKSLGIGLEDIALGGVIYRKAREQGVGTALPF